MWRRLRNLFLSFRTYADLSPDLGVRRRTNWSLRTRPSLSADEWYVAFWQPRQVSKSVADFVYTHLHLYSGLAVARVQPDDRLIEDLHLPLVCWFDWELSLCEDFFKCFEIDCGADFDLGTLATIEDLVLFLNAQLLSVNRF